MNPNAHLTEAELYPLLDVRLDASESTDAPAHLAHCIQCQSELLQLRETLTGLRIATTSMAQAQNVRLTRPEVFVPPSSRSSRYLFVWSAPFAIAALALSVMLTRPHPTATAPVTTTASTTASTSNLTGLSDDALLEAVSQDLSTSVPPSLEPLIITSSGTSTSN